MHTDNTDAPAYPAAPRSLSRAVWQDLMAAAPAASPGVLAEIVRNGDLDSFNAAIDAGLPQAGSRAMQAAHLSAMLNEARALCRADESVPGAAVLRYVGAIDDQDVLAITLMQALHAKNDWQVRALVLGGADPYHYVVNPLDPYKPRAEQCAMSALPRIPERDATNLLWDLLGAAAPSRPEHLPARVRIGSDGNVLRRLGTICELFAHLRRFDLTAALRGWIASGSPAEQVFYDLGEAALARVRALPEDACASLFRSNAILGMLRAGAVMHTRGGWDELRACPSGITGWPLLDDALHHPHNYDIDAEAFADMVLHLAQPHAMGVHTRLRGGMTFLMLAAHARNELLTRQLLALGADPLLRCTSVGRFWDESRTDALSMVGDADADAGLRALLQAAVARHAIMSVATPGARRRP